MSSNCTKSDAGVSFSSVLKSTFLLFLGFIIAIKIMEISCFLDESGLTYKIFPKSIIMLGAGIGLVRAGFTMATKI